MNYCSHCGAPVRLRIPAGDDRPRFVCDSCHTIHYQNPKMVVGCIPEREDKILLCRRAIEPRSGLWTIPAGFLENGETVIEGAKREAFEEARAKVEILSLYTLFDLTHINQVYLIFRARLLDHDYMPGEESVEIRLLEKEEIPWDDIAFPSIKKTLRLYFKDRPTGIFPIHMGTIPPFKKM
ncbi:MAG: NUDIX hydrolase [Deltaproteobacteria bacterium]|nr:MAG: NUDIX hydrolase [Deltaproteobacteria bacterium]